MNKYDRKQAAIQLQENKLLQELFDNLRVQYFNYWRNSKSIDERELIMSQTRALDGIERYIRAEAQTEHGKTDRGDSNAAH
jgi:hypothetical protein